MKSTPVSVTSSVIGVFLLALSLLASFPGPSAGTLELARSAKELEERRLKLEGEVSTADVRIKERRSKLAEKRGRNEGLAERLRRLDDTVAELEQKLRDEKEKVERAKRAKAKARAGDERRKKRREKNKKVVVLVASRTMKSRGSGVFLEHAGRTLVATSAAVVPEGTEDDVWVLFQRRFEGEWQKTILVKAELLDRGRRTGLAILEVSLPRAAAQDYSVATLDRSTFARARQGDKVYTIYGDAEFEGTVGSTSEGAGAGERLVVAVPVNPGCVGAPVFDRDGRMVGLIVEATGSAVLVAPAELIRQAVERAEKS